MIYNFPKLTRKEKIECFGHGEWIDELDFVEFEYNGICCDIVRNIKGGFLCGYIKIPEDHILYREMNDNIETEFDVHGGITFNEMITEEHWIGFDCAHCDDFVPALELFKKIHCQDFYKGNKELIKKLQITEMLKTTYKNIEFVKQELMSLAHQVLEYGK